jgi:hypothetical protein
MSVQISYAKPNPIGKDKTPSGTPKPEQLLGEWVDITNTGNTAIPFSALAVHHTRFDEACHVRPEPTEKYWSSGGSGALGPGQTLRVHTGRKRDEALLAAHPVDTGNVDWRAFADLDRFVLNNRCGDTIYVTWNDGRNGQQQDSAGYANNPPEGRVLKRVGARLLPV